MIRERFKVRFQSIEILERVKVEQRERWKAGTKKGKTEKNTYSSSTCVQQTVERRDTPSEWELREIRSIRLLKSANVLKYHNRAYAEQLGDILFLLFPSLIIKIQPTKPTVSSIFSIWDTRILLRALKFYLTNLLQNIQFRVNIIR